MTTLLQARALIRSREEFKAAAVTGTWVRHDRYVVYSYGPHWPLAIWTDRTGWVCNSTSYHRPTTNRHMALVRLALDYAVTPTRNVEVMRDFAATGEAFGAAIPASMPRMRDLFTTDDEVTQ